MGSNALCGGIAAIMVVDNVKPIKDASVTLSPSSVTYNGTKQTPAVTVKAGTKKLVQGTDYTVKYQNNLNAGTAKVIVTGKGNYSGTAEKTFRINKADNKITNVTSSVNIRAKALKQKNQTFRIRVR